MIGTLKEKLIAKLHRKTYRSAYIEAQVRTGIAYQVRALREQRNWTQEELGKRLGKGQNAVSRLEDPDYGRLNVSSLTELASAFDVALLIKFVPFTKFFIETADKSPEGLGVSSFDSESPALEKFARGNGWERGGKLVLGRPSNIVDVVLEPANEQSLSLELDDRRVAA